MLGFAPLTSVPLSSLPVATGRAATGFVTGGFGTPQAVYNQTQEATGFLTGAVGDPRYVWRVDATTIAPTTTFGDPRIFPYSAVGLQGGTTFGTPRLFPYHPVPINSTAFGTARLFPSHVGAWITSTQFGAPSGFQFWSVIWSTPATRFGTPTTPTDRACVATAINSTGIGWPSSNVHLPVSGDRTATAHGFRGTAFGSPRATWPKVGIASGAQFCSFGQPSADSGQWASGFSITNIGTPRSQFAQRAAGFKPVHYGFAIAVMTQRATGAMFQTRFGLPTSERSNTYLVYGINASGRFGQPKGFSRFNHPATGFCSTNMGSPTCHERHRALHIPPRITFGRPVLLRNPFCGRTLKASGSLMARYGTPTVRLTQPASGLASTQFGEPTT